MSSYREIRQYTKGVGLNTYRKLKDGSWAIAMHLGPNYVAGQFVTPPKSGDVVTVTLKNGHTKEETLGEQVGEYEGAVIFRAVPKPRERVISDVGNLTGVMVLFNKAREHLKFPKIVLAITELREMFNEKTGKMEMTPVVIETIRINVAGERAKVPGSLTIVSLDKNDNQGRKLWYGRIHTDGRFEQSHAVTAKHIDKLRAFASDPAKVASEDGKLTGNCSFCHKALDDERSTAVGYGPVCAKNFHLPWGARPENFADKAA